MVSIRVFRFDPDVDAAAGYETYVVPDTLGAMVLDALVPVRRYRRGCGGRREHWWLCVLGGR